MARRKEPDATRLLEAGGGVRDLHRRAKGFAVQEHVPADELRILTRDTVAFFEALAPEIDNALRERILQYDTLRDIIDDLRLMWILDSADSCKVRVSGRVYIRPVRYRRIVGLFAANLPALFCCLPKLYRAKLKTSRLFSEAASPRWRRVDLEEATQHTREILNLLRSAPEGSPRDRTPEPSLPVKASLPIARPEQERRSIILPSELGPYDPKRQRLLEEYKQHTGASNTQIYNARNSGISKPRFYAWLKGKLPDGSATTQNVERFLREKKRPIPRRPRG